MRASAAELPLRTRVLLLAPSRRAASETFIRANLARLPLSTTAYFGDELPLDDPLRLLYGSAILTSKLLTRLGLLKAATLPASLVTWLLIRRHRPDLVMVEFGFEAVRVMEAVAWTGRPLVVHFRGSDASARHRLERLRERYRRLMALSAGVIVKSEPMRRTLLCLGARADRLLISPSGADQIRFRGADPATAPCRLVAVGRLVPKKGPLLSLQAFARMRQRWLATPGIREEPQLVMVGEGPLRKAVEQQIAALGLHDCVELTGALGHDQVAALLRSSRGFIQHSLVAPDGDSEGCPVAVIEAQMSGLPVVATRHGGIPAVVEEGVSGWLVEEGDVEGMATAILRLIADPELAARMGTAGRRRALGRFTIEHHLAQVMELVQSVCGDQATQL